MSTLTDRLGIKKPDGSDPFLRSDFNATWDLLDDYPGIYPCTSSTHPAWGADQAGMCILEQDTGRILRWDGDSWELINNYPRVTAFSAAPNQTLGASSNTVYSLGNFVLPRASKVAIFAGVRYASTSTQSRSVNSYVTVDGTTIEGEYCFMPDVNSSANTIAVPILGQTTLLTAGAHALGIRSTVAAAGAIALSHLSVLVVPVEG